MRKFVLFIISYLLFFYNISAQVNIEKLKNNESKLIKDIINMRTFPKNKVFDNYFVVYNAYIPVKDWSIESIKDSKILSKLIFEKRIIKKNICKKMERISFQVYFVNSKVKFDYFYTDGDLFYTQNADLDTVLVHHLLNEKGFTFINIYNLNSNIYFAVENNEIKKIFDRRLGTMLNLENYLIKYSDRLKPDESFNFLYH